MLVVTAFDVPDKVGCCNNLRLRPSLKDVCKLLNAIGMMAEPLLHYFVEYLYPTVLLARLGLQRLYRCCRDLSGAP